MLILTLLANAENKNSVLLEAHKYDPDPVYLCGSGFEGLKMGLLSS